MQIAKAIEHGSNFGLTPILSGQIFHFVKILTIQEFTDLFDLNGVQKN